MRCRRQLSRRNDANDIVDFRRELIRERLVDLATGEVELGDVMIVREAPGFELIGG